MHICSETEHNSFERSDKYGTEKESRTKTEQRTETEAGQERKERKKR